jgi:tRNA dimethylallyltransferase
MAHNKILVVVAGPTAVGKTAAAIALAQYYNTAILSFDSRQCYTELNIGVARPSPEELQAVPHYFIATHSIHQPVDAAGFEQYALHTLDTLFAQKPVVIAVGGTGLYLKALTEGLDNMPAILPEVRADIRQQYEQHGMPWLQQAIAHEDPAYAANGEMQNPHRLLRALEVKRSSGFSIRHFQQNQPAQRPFATIKMGLYLSRASLVQRIDKRVEEMMQAGQLAEAQQLYPHRHLQALQTVGYSELFEYMENKRSLPDAIERICINTRQYARRQMTWFKRDNAIHWFEPTPQYDWLDWVTKQVAVTQTSPQK